MVEMGATMEDLKDERMVVFIISSSNSTVWL